MTDKGKKSGFFAVDTENWWDVFDTNSMNAAVAYLILCRGTGGDNSTTSWSVNAIEEYTGISRSRAKKAIEVLIYYGLVRQVKSGTRPQYKLRTDREPEKLSDARTIWLPNEIVTSTQSGETSPVERIRQTGDIMLLRLFVDLYKQQNLVEEGGIHRKVSGTNFTRETLNTYGQYRLYYFSRVDPYIYWNETTLPHRRDDLTDKEIEQGLYRGVDLFHRFRLLETLGLIQCVPHLFESDSDEAEIIHSLGSFESLEEDIRFAAENAAASMFRSLQGQNGINNTPATDKDYLLVPVPKHLDNVQVIGIWRLRYRPKTAMTSAWWAAYNEQGRQHLERYLSMVVEPVNHDGEAPLQHQG